MSAPTPAPGDDTPREGFYPDPSIPGYVRYWNGASWVPGTSRPAPEGSGAPLAPSASAGAVSPGSAPAVPTVEETGPHFFDEDPVDEPSPSQSAASSSPSASLSPSPSSPFSPSPSPADSQHGSRPEPASAWGADRSRQSGFGGDQDRRISWGADPRTAHASGPAGGESAGAGTGTGGADAGAAPAGNTFVFRPPAATSRSADGGSGAASATAAPSDGATADEGTMTFRAVGPRRGSGAASLGRPGFGAGKAAAARAAGTASGQAGSGSPASAPASGPQQASPAPAVPSQATAPAPVPATGPAPTATPAAVPGPLTSGHGGGQSSWAQQAHRLGDGEEPPVAPWKPPVEDVFQAAARRQASARPATLGKRLVARLLDTVVLGGVTALAAVPLGIAAADHIDEKIDAARLSGETVTVWLLDGTTSVYLGVVLAVLLLGGILYEVLPTAKWGRTLGKKLLGLEVRDIEGHDVPGFGAALRRWLVYSVPGVLVVGVVGVLWCLFDKPWRQCWHDKAAHTFVAG
ncbi:MULTISPECIES: RDD family protein [unclassified Streptomyces]|uniref:RDD family protein n=1 Tax=unclassified Streptomyces TaxID=2593676 RepID=UPI00083E0F61|nr:RDD family protein [Streptomyces sp. AVP053U2]ODA75087.1 RDD family protein [Streptomyces sp. AVP053U2]